MTNARILHYLTQWMWLSNSFVFGPIAATQHRLTVVSRMPVINEHVYPPPEHLISLGDRTLEEGADTAAAVVEQLGGRRPALVHLHHGYNLPDATALASALGVPLAVSFWGYDVTALPCSDPERVLPYLSTPDLVIVPSRFLAEVVLSLRVDPARVRVVPGSVQARFFRPGPLPPEPRVAFVGRFVAKKGIDVLLSAWAIVRQAVPEAQLVLLGFGDPVPVAHSRLGVRIQTPDLVDPRRQVHNLLRWCRVYVSPSRTGPDGDSESQHIGNLEAQAAGRVVLTTDHGPIPEFVEHEVTGVIVPQGDHRALADAMIALLVDLPRCDRLAQHAAIAARRFHIERISEEHDAMYAELLGTSRPC